MRDGIYFNLPEDEYLAEERLSKSGIKRLRVSAADYWVESHLNPNPPELTPEQERSRHMARLIGRAYHCARLEPDRFASIYVREITTADFNGQEGFLSSGREIEAELAERGLPKKSKDDAGVLDQAKRLKAAGYEGPIWHIAEEEWRASVKPGQVVIPAKAYEEIMVDMERIRMVPAVHKLLTGGEPEVSVFWTCPETGIPMKARFDYLKPDRWVEFKTFANSSRKALFQAITDAIRFERYHIDAAAYMEAAEAIRSGVLDVVGEASDAERELIAAIQARPVELACHFVFQQKGGVPNILERAWRFFESPSDDAVRELEESGAPAEKLERARKMQAMSSRSRTIIHTKGRMEIAAAKRDFLAYSEIYERGEPWLPFNPSGEITDADFSQYFLEEAI
jgi:hypothetical protein